MSLTSLFNFSYLKENIKKSKAIILLCILLLPIINGIILLMNCSNGYNFMPSTFEVSSVILLGMYIVPIVLSITLFNFIYKKGSVLFTLSMPISKKQIFLTNTIGGIVIILLMHIINFIISFIISLLYSNFIVDTRMFFDILLIYSISYIFVFTASNVAISLSSNKITTIVILLLVLFLVPFVNTFISSNGFRYFSGNNARVECTDKACTPIIYECGNVKCEVDRKNNIYNTYVTKVDNNTYTLPYELINNYLFGMESEIDYNSSLLKMSFLSIVYIFIGYALFIKKKFEVVGTSFRSENIHILVRSLTTIPIACVAYVIFNELDMSGYDFFSIILLLVLIFAYLIIYDLVTRKKVTNVFKMAICLAIVFGLVCFTGAFFDNDDYMIDVNNIKTMSILDENNVSKGTTKNRDVINYVMSLLIDTSPRGVTREYYSIGISSSDGDYRFVINVTEDDYKYINDILINDKEYIKSNKKYREANVFGIGYIDGYTSSDNKISKMIIDEYNKYGNVYDEYYDYDYNGFDDFFEITLYVYDNYRVRSVNLGIAKDSEVVKELFKYYNNNTKKYLSNLDMWSYSYYANDKYYGSYEELGKFIVNNIDDDIDTSIDYNFVRINGINNRYVFATNKVNELNDVLDGYYSNIGDTDEKYYD